MHYIVIFESDHFDLAGEDPNPINPNHGQSVGLWMAPLLESRGLEVSEVLAEDWGWYLGATLGDRGYLVGFAGHPAEEPGGASELIVQVRCWQPGGPVRGWRLVEQFVRLRAGLDWLGAMAGRELAPDPLGTRRDRAAS